VRFESATGPEKDRADKKPPTLMERAKETAAAVLMPEAQAFAKIDQASGTATPPDARPERAVLEQLQERASSRLSSAAQLDADQAKSWAAEDYRAMERLQGSRYEVQAAARMAQNAVANPEYAAELQRLEREDAEKVATKDARKQAEFEAMQRERIERAQAWTPEVAAARAQEDVARYRQERDETERYYSGSDMALNAQHNQAYRSTLQRVAPDVATAIEIDRKREPANEPVAPRGDAANDATKGADMAIDAAALQRVAQARARDTQKAAEELGLNGIEPSIERKAQQQLDAEAEAKRAAWLQRGQQQDQSAPPPRQAQQPGRNDVESDEVFTASKTDTKPMVPQDIEDRYLRVGDKFYHPKNRDVVVFEDKGNRLETRSDSEQVAEALVTIARARGWDEIKVSGTETFRREAWLEAAAHGMHVKGYTPSEQDKAELAKRVREAEANKVEPENKPIRARETQAADKGSEAPAGPPGGTGAATSKQPDHDANDAAERHSRAEAFAKKPPAEAVKEHPELAGTYAAMASIEKKVEADHLSAEQRAIVMARVKQNIVNSIERGELPEVKVREETVVTRDRAHEREEDREVSR
jgi:hypothetical protein